VQPFHFGEIVYDGIERVRDSFLADARGAGWLLPPSVTSAITGRFLAWAYPGLSLEFVRLMSNRVWKEGDAWDTPRSASILPDHFYMGSIGSAASHVTDHTPVVCRDRSFLCHGADAQAASTGTGAAAPPGGFDGGGCAAGRLCRSHTEKIHSIKKR
jgi:hypothetical protein